MFYQRVTSSASCRNIACSMTHKKSNKGREPDIMLWLVGSFPLGVNVEALFFFLLYGFTFFLKWSKWAEWEVLAERKRGRWVKGLDWHDWRSLWPYQEERHKLISALKQAREKDNFAVISFIELIVKTRQHQQMAPDK